MRRAVQVARRVEASAGWCVYSSLDRGHREARVVEGGTDIRIRVEVLPVLLAERVTVTGPRELDPGVAGAGAGIDDAADHEVVPGRLYPRRWGWRS